jgi:3-deoxy-manno-octulosonate cytidylyltransferase (CMP-KDO synthetase)
MSVAVIIPARMASTRLPDKPLLKETGKYLIQHVVERVRQARGIDRILVATDDQRIVRACAQFGAEAVMTRRDHPSGTDRIAEAAAKLDQELILNVQGDEPELPAGHIEACLSALRDGGAPMATVACPLAAEDAANPNRVKVVLRRDGRALYFSRSLIPFPRDGGPLPPGLTHLLHIGMYGYRREFLLEYPKLPPCPLEQAEKLEQLRALYYGYDIAVAQVQGHQAGIDTAADYAAFVARMRGVTR